eukprot:1522294-Rhodomonas_salina.3
MGCWAPWVFLAVMASWALESERLCVKEMFEYHRWYQVGGSGALYCTNGGTAQRCYGLVGVYERMWGP